MQNNPANGTDSYTKQTYNSYTKQTFVCKTDPDIQPNANRVAQNLEIISKNCIFIPGVPGFSWDL